MSKSSHEEKPLSTLIIYALVGGAIVLLSLFYIAQNFQTQRSITGSGNLVTVEPNVLGFTAIQVGGGFSVGIAHSASYSVKITADDNVIDHILVSNTGGTLGISLESGSYTMVTLKAEITMPSIAGIDLSGGTTGTLSGFENQNALTVMLSGGSVLHIPEISVTNLTFDLSGGSRTDGTANAVSNAHFILSGGSSATLHGNAANMLIDSIGGSNLNLFEFMVHNANVTMSGGGTANINLDGKLNADLNGGSRIIYDGTPELGTIILAGGSTVTKR